MKTYEDYLIQEDYSKGTVTSYAYIKGQFITWCDANDYEPEQIDYKACLEYVKKLQAPKNGKVNSKRTVKHRVGALKNYFKYLIEENYRGDNPMESINIRGVKRTLNHNLLDFEELEDLYYSCQTHNVEFPCSPQVASRNKVMIGLMVYQGLNATSFKVMTPENINIEKGRIYIPGTRNTNARELEIKSWQILPLVRYLEQDRPILQEELNCHTEALFPLNSDRFSIITAQLFKQLRKVNHKVKDSKQIRASVITHWLSENNIRKVQYMAGHRYISSTERYVQDDLESLHDMIDSLHPIG